MNYLRDLIQTKLELASYCKAFIEYSNFIFSGNHEELLKYLHWEGENKNLDLLEDKLIDRFGYDDLNLISLIGFQMYLQK